MYVHVHICVCGWQIRSLNFIFTNFPIESSWGNSVCLLLFAVVANAESYGHRERWRESKKCARRQCEKNGLPYNRRHWHGWFIACRVHLAEMGMLEPQIVSIPGWRGSIMCTPRIEQCFDFSISSCSLPCVAVCSFHWSRVARLWYV